MHAPKLFAPLAILSLVAAQSSAQLLDWLPIQDLPLTRWEAEGQPIAPGTSSACLWDPDGDGPLPRCVVLAGTLNLVIPNGHNIAFLTPDGWVGIPEPDGSGTIYSMETYTAPGRNVADLFVALNGRGVHRRDGNTWTHLLDLPSPHVMTVLDLDGDGPQAPILAIGARDGVYIHNGATTTQLLGGISPTDVWSLLMWDRDGDGPLPARLLAAGSGIREWNGSQWNVFEHRTSGYVHKLCAFDFDSEGPNPPELVAVGSFTTMGGVNTGPVAALRNGTWVGLGTPFTGNVVENAVSFDPDLSGPMPPRLVVCGDFSQIGGLAARRLAYFVNGGWNLFPEHWMGTAVVLEVNDDAGFSDSPQLLIAGLATRPAFAAFALCDGPAGYRNDPAGGRRPQGETLSIGVVPTGDELSFRWYKGTTPVVRGTTASGSVISGTASPRLTISGLTPQDEGEYHLTVGNAFGTVTTQNAAISLGCAADFNADDTVDFPDYLDFITAFVNGDPVSDFNNDMEFDLFDYLDFVQAFSSPC